MSAPKIPNLSTLRREGIKGRVRGVSPGAASTGLLGSSRQANKDEIIRNTDHDASASRLCAVEAGYLDDQFAKLLRGGEETPRRLPLMNRGTYIRTTGIDLLVDIFLSSIPYGRKQIISFGAGSDTRYFRLKQKQPDLDVLYHELDFDTNTRSKIARLRASPFVSIARSLCQIDLLSSDFELVDDGTRLKSPSYHIHPQDLRHLSKGKPALPNIDTSLPTLLISECCLIYLTPNHADSVMSYFTNLFQPSIPLAIVIYEPIRPDDPFGRTMISNLIARGIQLQTLEKYAGIREQKVRLEQNGFQPGVGGGANAVDIDWLWRKWIAEAEKERVEALEWMDEVEEFVLLAQHYCISYGWKGFEDDTAWRELHVPM